MNCLRELRKNCFSLCHKNEIANRNEIDIIVIGLSGSGKTELCHQLCELDRTDFTSTVGVKVFKLEYPEYSVRLIEIGGNERLIDIWQYYYADCMGVIFTIKCDRSQLYIKRNRNIIKTLLAHNSLNGKPFVILGTFQDVPPILNVFELSYVYDFENYAEIVKTPIFVDVCGKDSYRHMKKGLTWMTRLIHSNYHNFTNRIEFDRKRSLILEELRVKRELADVHTPRPSTAPPTFKKKKRKVKPLSTRDFENSFDL